MKAASVVRQAWWAAAMVGLAVLAWTLPCRGEETTRGTMSSGQDVTADDSVEQAAFRLLRRRPCPPCPPQYTPAAPSAVAPAVPQPAAPAKPGEVSPAIPPAAAEAVPPGALASAVGATGGTLATAPNMIGDFFGATTISSYYVMPPNGYDDECFHIASPASGGVVGRMKIAENTSALPQDRLLFNYSYFDNVPLYPGGVNVHRFMPGFEKTFLDGMTSLEVKVPMAVSLDSTIVADGGTDLSHGEFGNLMITPKVLLMQTDNFAAALGMSVSVPTADDVRLVLSDGTELLRIDNQSVFLAPFVGALWTDGRWFVQAFLQYDVDVNGSPVSSNLFQERLQELGRLRGTTFQYLDIGVGYWMYRSACPCDFVRGVALTGEIHWNQSLESGDTIQSLEVAVGEFNRNIEIWDLTMGMHVDLCDRTTLTVGYSLPIGNGADQQFDGELRVMLNHFFGPYARPAAAAF
jgi:hypothetical protein